MRYGEMTAFEERPHSPYFGSADATQLFVVLLDEYERWTGDTKLVRELEYEARAGAELDRRVRRPAGQRLRRPTSGATRRPGSRTSAGRTRRTRSRTATARCPGSRERRASCRATPTTPRSAAPAWPARCGTTTQFAAELERQAADLKRRFNRDFWVEDDEYFAVALDADGRQVDSLTSNIGHLLWSGIVDKSKAKAVVRHLMGDRLFSGWGVRTLAEGEGRYNPIGYHVGTVWPFDNSFIAWGLRRYGFKDEAARIAAGILDAAEFFEGRLPEAFGGYPREMTKYPVQYPTACSPQAWSTGTPLLLLRTMLGLEPVGRAPRRRSRAARRRSVALELLDIPGRWGRVDAFGRGRVDTTAAGSTEAVAVGRQAGRGWTAVTSCSGRAMTNEIKPIAPAATAANPKIAGSVTPASSSGPAPNAAMPYPTW